MLVDDQSFAAWIQDLGHLKTIELMLDFRNVRPRVSKRLWDYRFLSIDNVTGRTWTLHRYPSLRSPESVLPKPMEILADAEKYTSFRGFKQTIQILTAFGFLKTVERSTHFIDSLPLIGNITLVMKRVTAAALPYLAEESHQVGIKPERQITTREFDKIFPVLRDDLIDHARLVFI